jgi:hypothetical protein
MKLKQKLQQLLDKVTDTEISSEAFEGLYQDFKEDLVMYRIWTEYDSAYEDIVFADLSDAVEVIENEVESLGYKKPYSDYYFIESIDVR